MLLARMVFVMPGSDVRNEDLRGVPAVGPKLLLGQFGVGGALCQERLKSVSRSRCVWGCHTMQSPTLKRVVLGLYCCAGPTRDGANCSHADSL